MGAHYITNVFYNLKKMSKQKVTLQGTVRVSRGTAAVAVTT